MFVLCCVCFVLLVFLWCMVVDCVIYSFSIFSVGFVLVVFLISVCSCIVIVDSLGWLKISLICVFMLNVLWMCEINCMVSSEWLLCLKKLLLWLMFFILSSVFYSVVNWVLMLGLGVICIDVVCS